MHEHDECKLTMPLSADWLPQGRQSIDSRMALARSPCLALQPCLLLGCKAEAALRLSFGASQEVDAEQCNSQDA